MSRRTNLHVLAITMQTQENPENGTRNIDDLQKLVCEAFNKATATVTKHNEIIVSDIAKNNEVIVSEIAKNNEVIVSAIAKNNEVIVSAIAKNNEVIAKTTADLHGHIERMSAMFLSNLQGGRGRGRGRRGNGVPRHDRGNISRVQATAPPPNADSYVRLPLVANENNLPNVLLPHGDFGGQNQVNSQNPVGDVQDLLEEFDLYGST